LAQIVEPSRSIFASWQVCDFLKTRQEATHRIPSARQLRLTVLTAESDLFFRAYLSIPRRRIEPCAAGLRAGMMADLNKVFHESSVLEAIRRQHSRLPSRPCSNSISQDEIPAPGSCRLRD